MPSAFDLAVVRFLNQFAQSSWLFDQMVVHLVHVNLIKAGVVAVLIWWVWFRDFETGSHRIGLGRKTAGAAGGSRAGHAVRASRWHRPPPRATAPCAASTACSDPAAGLPHSPSALRPPPAGQPPIGPDLAGSSPTRPRSRLMVRPDPIEGIPTEDILYFTQGGHFYFNATSLHRGLWPPQAGSLPSGDPDSDPSG